MEPRTRPAAVMASSVAVARTSTRGEPTPTTSSGGRSSGEAPSGPFWVSLTGREGSGRRAVASADGPRRRPHLPCRAHRGHPGRGVPAAQDGGAGDVPADVGARPGGGHVRRDGRDRRGGARGHGHGGAERRRTDHRPGGG